VKVLCLRHARSSPFAKSECCTTHRRVDSGCALRRCELLVASPGPLCLLEESRRTAQGSAMVKQLTLVVRTHTYTTRSACLLSAPLSSRDRWPPSPAGSPGGCVATRRRTRNGAAAGAGAVQSTGQSAGQETRATRRREWRRQGSSTDATQCGVRPLLFPVRLLRRCCCAFPVHVY
jgi:hypothetical protein